MASVFNLTRNAVAVNLISARDAGWRATRWYPSVAAVTGNRMPPLVRETVSFEVDEQTHDQLATTFQAMDNYRWLAREYINDRTQEHPVWLHAKMDNETGERRALVYDVGLQWQVDQVDENGMYVCDGNALARAEITRGPLWEDTTVNTKTAAVNLSVLAGTWDYSGADVVGDAPARIAELDMRHQNTTHYTQYWIGFRGANKHGTLANFVPIWELEGGTPGTDTTAQALAGASPGAGNTGLRCTFATATWASRATIYLTNVTVNPGDNLGRFVCLLRAKVDAGTTAEVQLSQGYHATPVLDGVLGPITEITSTSWAIYNLGIVTIPLRDMHVFPLATWAATHELYYKLILRARRTGGAGNLEMDCLVMIPYDELFFYINRPETYSGNYRMVFGQSPEGLWAVYGYFNTAPSDYWRELGEISAYGLGVPVGDGRAYIVMATAADANVYTEVYKAELKIFPRWYNLRGTE
jgi:hypothetical protein